MTDVTRRFATKRDAIEQAILPMLDVPADYDEEKIFSECFAYRVDHDEQGNELLNTAGFEETVTTEQFWKVVEASQITRYLETTHPDPEITQP